jgi:hypothetical protein
MDDDLNCCEICLEEYNTINRISKQLPCCGKIYCLKCLSDIYNKNKKSILCPICKKQTPSILPVNLPTKMVQIIIPKTIKNLIACMTCYNSVQSSSLKININNLSISCEKCDKSSDNPYLEMYLENLKEEAEFMKQQYSKQLSVQELDRKLDNYLSQELEKILMQIKNNIKNELKNKIINSQKVSFSTIKDFQMFYEDSKNLKEVNENNFLQIFQSISFYTNNAEKLKESYKTLSSLDKQINENKLLSFCMHVNELEKLLLQNISISSCPNSNNNKNQNRPVNINSYETKSKKEVEYEELISLLKNELTYYKQQFQYVNNKNLISEQSNDFKAEIEKLKKENECLKINNENLMSENLNFYLKSNNINNSGKGNPRSLSQQNLNFQIMGMMKENQQSKSDIGLVFDQNFFKKGNKFTITGEPIQKETKDNKGLVSLFGEAIQKK